jgi:hypothetical protein
MGQPVVRKPNMGHEGRWLRHVDDGQIFHYTDTLAKNPKVEEVTEKEAFPERFMTKKQKNRKSELDLSTDPKKVEKAKKPKKKTKAALASDASKGLPAKGKGSPAKSKGKSKKK